MKFTQFLTEVFDKTVDYNIVKDNKYFRRAEFQIGDKSYSVLMFGEGELDSIIWDISFGLTTGGFSTNDITNTGDEYLVFATVGKIIMGSIDAKNMDFISFSAKEPSRVKLYNRFARKLANGRKIETRVDENDETVYTIQVR